MIFKCLVCVDFIFFDVEYRIRGLFGVKFKGEGRRNGEIYDLF